MTNHEHEIGSFRGSEN